MQETTNKNSSSQTNLRLNEDDLQVIKILMGKTGLKTTGVVKLAIRELLKNLT